MPTPAIELHRIAKLYGRTAALRNITMRLEPGQTLALLGPNGSGKTTLLKILAGASTPTIGTGLIFGHDIAANRRELRSHVGLLSAETYLYDDLSALENLRFMVTMAGRRPEQERLLTALDDVGLREHRDERVRGFSSGMKRRLSLARLLLQEPRLMLLDEPYNSLDAEGAELVDGAVRKAAGDGCVVILATHDAERALALADLVAVLERGAMTSLGPPQSWRARHAQYVG